jgi:hypothetical protein
MQNGVSMGPRRLQHRKELDRRPSGLIVSPIFPRISVFGSQDKIVKEVGSNGRIGGELDRGETIL